MMTSRYIRTSDHRVTEVVVPIPAYWWSRPYEYAWAAEFAEREHVALDAACGISHPFKLFLARACKEAQICDRDQRILSVPEILKATMEDMGSTFDVSHEVEKLGRSCADVTKLPYGDPGYFDRVFFLGVLQELSTEDATRALSEFRRVLKPDGLLIVTFDVPTRTPAAIAELARGAGFEFAGPLELEEPTDAMASGGLKCFRAVLRRTT